MSKPSDSTLVIIPTYNERENLVDIVGRLRQAEPEVDVVVVDDNSPDGTGQAADELAADDDKVHVIHRTAKNGLCAAYCEGFAWALQRDYQVICEMDADGSHAPEELHRLLDRVDQGADVVIGSRYIPGGEVKNWPKKRFFLSRLGNIYISAALGAQLSDMTAGYRAYRRSVIEALDLEELSNAGYIFQVDLAWRAVQREFDVREVPITFVERQRGESKLDSSFVTASLKEVTRWGLKHRTRQLKDFAEVSASLVKHEVGNKLFKK
ncbi:polyprenol monophosphomannose synthase [Corynebacterium mendelii]|uniref:dolichyl-phosphate beta-D-mannosyltransferase n=1 Tax=Corynebacterium mendelii TaxID=2765362 RepID=A0A939IWL1_9CORY|nr:polyprenol monophosphomannose synthase [Corynebacterium mendelii]MBN9643535.1 polyprenol monophosphomannose synthase [Corynebacterium mendelii]